MRHRGFGGTADPGGGVGAMPPQERKSEGGWAGQSGAQRTLLRDGGVGGAAPITRDPRSPSRRRRVRRPGGGVGAKPPHERKSEGGWAGLSGAQRTLVRDGGVGGAAPHKRPTLALGAMPRAPARRGCGGEAPTGKKIRGWVGGPSGAQRTLLPDGGVGGCFDQDAGIPRRAPHKRDALARAAEDCGTLPSGD